MRKKLETTKIHSVAGKNQERRFNDTTTFSESYSLQRFVSWRRSYPPTWRISLYNEFYFF
jgi:hypothetical protein